MNDSDGWLEIRWSEVLNISCPFLAKAFRSASGLAWEFTFSEIDENKSLLE